MSEIKYLIKFGKYDLDDVADRDLKKNTFIGRTKAQIFMVGELFKEKGNRAFLITGNRGVGKTTFVDECLDEYIKTGEARFLKRPTFAFQNFFNIVLVGLFAIFLMACTTEFLVISVSNLLAGWAGMHDPISAGQVISFLFFLASTSLLLFWLIILPGFWLWRYSAADYYRLKKKESGVSTQEHRNKLITTETRSVWAVMLVVVTLVILLYFTPVADSWERAIFFILLAQILYLAFSLVIYFLAEGEPFLFMTVWRSMCLAWLPVIKVSVNLGFEKLDHPQIIHAMLVGLLREYKRNLVGRKYFEYLRRCFWTSLIVLSSTSTVAILEASQTCGKSTSKDICSAVLTKDSKITDRVNIVSLNTEIVTKNCESKVSEIGCNTSSILDQISFERTHDFNTQEFLVSPISGTDISINSELFLVNKLFPVKGKDALNKLNLTPLFIVSMVFYWLVITWVRRLFLPCDYRFVERRLRQQIVQLNAAITSREVAPETLPINLLAKLTAKTKSTFEANFAPQDSRSIELGFRSVLEDIAKLRDRTALFRSPQPEIVFVFDEMDKLAVSAEPRAYKGEDKEIQFSGVSVIEGQRSVLSKRLLSDLKQLITDSAARYVFIGGRSLHDEWLAEQGARRKLIRSVFDTEIYIPSLLIDKNKNPDFEASIRHYLSIQFSNAVSRQKNKSLHPLKLRQLWQHRRKPIFGEVETSVYEEKDNDKVLNAQKVMCYRGSGNQNTSTDWVLDKPVSLDYDTNAKEFFLTSFNKFLAYRSLGIPKSLRSVLSGYIRDSETEFNRLKPIGSNRDSENCLRFAQANIYQIQLIERVYQAISNEFNDGLSVRHDDKPVLSMMRVFDFIFKFHHRAFNWRSLERMDELLHIHKINDLRAMLGQIIDSSIETNLIPVLNGMYGYRFRRDISKEIEFLSRISTDEMAAFNFSLDESQTLKEDYKHLIQKRPEDAIDIIEALAELYEYDQDYDLARKYLRWAIEQTSQKISELISPSTFAVVEDGPRPNRSHNISAQQEDQISELQNLYNFRPDQVQNTQYMPWAISRLRLLLQLGMTYEKSNDYENAWSVYSHAELLAARLRQLFLHSLVSNDQESEKYFHFRDHGLEHQNLLFQPLFAIAWVSEKLHNVVDTSVRILEEFLAQVHTDYPFIKEIIALGNFDVDQVSTLSRPKHSNMALVAAELHKKTGDLYFYKGFPATKSIYDEDYNQEDGNDELDRLEPQYRGYMSRCHYHYAMAIRFKLRYIDHRVYSAEKATLNLIKYDLKNKRGSKRQAGVPIPNDRYPLFVYESLVDSVCKLGDTILAGTDMVKLFDDIVKRDAPITSEQGFKNIAESQKDFKELFYQFCSQSSQNITLKQAQFGDGESLIHYFLKPKNNVDLDETGAEDEKLLLTEGGEPTAYERLIMSLRLYLLAGDLANNLGRERVAERHYQKVLQTVFSVASGFSLHSIVARGAKQTVIGFPLGNVMQLTKIISMAHYALRQVNFYLPVVDTREKKHQVGGRIRLRLAIIVLAFGAYLSRLSGDNKEGLFRGFRDEIKNLLAAWNIDVPENSTNKFIVEEDYLNNGHAYIDALEAVMLHQIYPFHSRLYGHCILLELYALIPQEEFAKRNRGRYQALTTIETLWHETKQYNAPSLVTSFQVGSAMAYCLLSHHVRDGNIFVDEEGDENVRFRITRSIEYAQTLLLSAARTHSMGIDYYQVIEDMYYLYDDFSESISHYRLGNQMFGNQVNATLRTKLQFILKKEKFSY